MVNSSVLVTSIALAIIVAVATVVTVHRRTSLAKITALLLSATTLVGIGITSTASASATLTQATLSVSNTNTSGTAGTGITLEHAGGSGTGAISWKVTAGKCTVTTGVLNASVPGTCGVEVIKATSGNYKAATSASKNFTFAAADQTPVAITNSTLAAKVNSDVTVTTSGGSGTGKLAVTVSGTNCTIKAGVLTATAAASCIVTATKPASGIYTSSTDTKTFVFSTDAQSAFSITNVGAEANLARSVVVNTTGGSGTGKMSFTASPSGCVVSSKGVLTTTSTTPITCTVTATKGASGSYAAATATQTFIFQAIAYQAKLTAITGSTGAQINFNGDANQGGDVWFLNQYYSSLDNWLFDYVPAGAAVTETWTITNGAGVAAANLPVTFDQTFAGGNSATWTGNGTGGVMTGTTNSHGVVTFTFHNSNTASGLNPNDTTTGPGANGNLGSYPWSRGALIVGTPATGLSNGELGSTVNGHSYIWDAGDAGASVITQTTDLVDLIVIPGSGALKGQAAFAISNATASNLVGTNVTLTTSGGSGSGAVSFSVSGSGCSITTGVLSDTGAGTCNVTATKAADSTYGAATATKTFTFTNAPDNPTVAHPDVATLTSETIGSTTTAAASIGNNTAAGDGEFINAFYNATDNWYLSYLTPGQTVSMTWHVNGADGNALKNAAVTLQTGFAGSASLTGDAQPTWSGTGSETVDASGNVTANTDSSGNVTFTLTNTSTSGGPTPTDFTAGTAANNECNWNGINCAGATDAFSRMVLVVGSDVVTANPNTTVNQATDLVDFIVYGSAPVTPTQTENSTYAHPDTASFVQTSWSSTGLLGTGVLDNTTNGLNWFLNEYFNNQDHWYQTYAVAGSTIHLTFHVTGSYGQDLANQAVTLDPNLPYAGNAVVSNWTGTLTGTTDSNGMVTFDLKNTDTVTGTQPTDINTQPTVGNPVADEKGTTYPWSRFVLHIGSTDSINSSDWGFNATQATDMVDVIVVPSA